MSADLSIIEEFRVHQNRNPDQTVSSEMKFDDEHNEEVRRRVSYTKEQKLEAISYATTTWKTQKDGSSKLISKNAAAKDLGITPAMLRQWLKDKSEIESSTRGTRKRRDVNISCQEPEMENRLVERLLAARKMGKKITNRWLMLHAKNIYEELHPHRVIKQPGQSTEYSGFKFSVGWLSGFKRRHRVVIRSPTINSQDVSFFFFLE